MSERRRFPYTAWTAVLWALVLAVDVALAGYGPLTPLRLGVIAFNAAALALNIAMQVQRGRRLRAEHPLTPDGAGLNNSRRER